MINISFYDYFPLKLLFIHSSIPIPLSPLQLSPLSLYKMPLLQESPRICRPRPICQQWKWRRFHLTLWGHSTCQTKNFIRLWFRTFLSFHLIIHKLGWCPCRQFGWFPGRRSPNSSGPFAWWILVREWIQWIHNSGGDWTESDHRKKKNWKIEIRNVWNI